MNEHEAHVVDQAIGGYAGVAAAPGVWTCPMRLPAAPLARVRDELAALARTTGWPVAAFLYGDAGEPVTELLLYRDPSRTFGTPDIDECGAAVRALTAATGWTTAAELAPAGGVLVGVGLREGYAPDAPQHESGEVTRRLAACGTGWTCRTARLVSARWVDGDVRWYDEVGVVVHASARLRPTIAETALALGQCRIMVTDLAIGQTYVLARQETVAS